MPQALKTKEAQIKVARSSFQHLGPVYMEKSCPGQEGHPPSRVNFTERLYEKKVDPFAKSWKQSSRMLWMSRLDGVDPISFPELRSPWPAVGKRELWQHPFQACATNAPEVEENQYGGSDS